MTRDDEREAKIRDMAAAPGWEWTDVRFLLRRLDEARRPPTLADIRERNRGALFFEDVTLRTEADVQKIRDRLPPEPGHA